MAEQVMKPIIVGAAKCARKGHRPLTKSGRCTRCGDWVMEWVQLTTNSEDEENV
jgi:hypothetical protein